MSQAGRGLAGRRACSGVIANEMTTDKKWPRALPDPHKLAVKAHKKIQNRLLHVRFRDNNQLMNSLLIDYSSGDEDYKQYADAESESKAGPAPASAAPAPAAAANVEKGGVCC